jgi:hypothetical protein
MSLELDRPRWDKFTLPLETTAQPVAGPDVAALMIKGKRIEQIAAFSPASGSWVAQMLLKPVEDELNPVVGQGFALYQAGNDFYAFSSHKGMWAVLHLEGDEQASVSMSLQDIEVMQGNRLYVFALKQGEWSKPVEVYVPERDGTSKSKKPADAQKPTR